MLDGIRAYSLFQATLGARINALNYEVETKFQRFCDTATCPFGPGNTSFKYQFNVSEAFQGVSFNSELVVLNGVETSNVVACIRTETTPILQPFAWYPLVFGVLGIALLVGATFLLTSYLNPWTGTKNVYLWSSNFGHDSSVVRLLTPGFFDFIKYLQFAVFLTSLSLQYPGFLQPVISTFAWSCLWFPATMLAGNSGKLQDGLYLSNATYGIQSMSQIVQISAMENIWGGFMIYLLIIVCGVLFLCESGALAVWGWRKARKLESSDLKKRNLPFVIGLILRLIFNLFAYPLLVFSFFQCLVTSQTKVYLTVLAVLVIVAWVLTSAWIIYQLYTTKPRHALFDDLNNMLRYGTFYNTFNEQGSMFFLVDFLTVFMRGITVGVIQASGLAQLILLAIIELLNFFCILVMKPFDKDTSQNLITCLMCALRFTLIFLSLPFVKTLDIDVVVRQWLGYIILICHALVFLLFLMHAFQVTIEVISRYNGAGTDEKAGAIFSLSQLSRRRKSVKAPNEKLSLPEGMSQKTGDGQLSLPKDPNNTAQISPTINSPQESFVANTLLSRRQTYGTTHTGSATRDSMYDDIYVSSPVSEISSIGVSTPLSANPNSHSSTGYYRKPRRRPSSHEWANVNQFMHQDDAAAKETAAMNGAEVAEIRAGLVSPPPAGVDYAVREADVYYTKRQYSSHSRKKKRSRRKQKQEDVPEGGDGEHDTAAPFEFGRYGSIDSGTYVGHYPDGRMSMSRDESGFQTGVLTSSSKHRPDNPNSFIGLLEVDPASDTAGSSSNKDAEVLEQQEQQEQPKPTDGFTRLAGWLKLKGKRPSFLARGSSSKDEPSIEPRGFEVIRRGPIRPYQQSESDTSSSASSLSGSDSDDEDHHHEHENPPVVENVVDIPARSVLRPTNNVDSYAAVNADHAAIPPLSTSSSSNAFIFPSSTTTITPMNINANNSSSGSTATGVPPPVVLGDDSSRHTPTLRLITDPDILQSQQGSLSSNRSLNRPRRPVDE